MPKFNNVPNELIIHNGENKWLSRSLVVVVTVILNNEKALIVKRGSNMTQPGKWCNPCGYLDWNESGTQASIREVWEETGIDLSKIIEESPEKIYYQSMFNPWDIITNPKLNHNQDVALYYGICINSEDEPEIHNKNCEEGEIDEVRWVKFDELKDYDFAFNHDKIIIKYLNHINEELNYKK